MFKNRWSKVFMQIMTVFTLLVIGTGCSPDTTTSEEIDTSTETSESIMSDTEESQEEEAETSTPGSSEEDSKEAASGEESPTDSQPAESKISETPSPSNQTPPSVPEGEAYVVVNDNIPYFTNEDIASTEAYAEYGPLDSLGRVTPANAVLGVELMPAEEREAISSVTPTGWNQARYVNVSGGWLYNRSHLIGFQLTGENANPNNLMTGTRWFNVEGMLPFENFVANYIETTENHVRYRITPVFEDNNLLASGIYMEGFSIEDNGAEVQFNIYVPNIQPGVEIDYSDGSSVGPEGPQEEDEVLPYPQTEEEAIAPTEDPAETPAPAPSPEEDLSAIDTNGNGIVTIQEAEDAGYQMPITSDHWLYPYMIDQNNDGMVGE